MKPRLLIVDDDASIGQALAERFLARGFQVARAASGREALEKARQGQDLLLLDLQLPHGDGLSVLRELKAEGNEATVIVITAHGSVEKAVEAIREGAYDFVEKPFDAKRLEETVRRALERSRLRRENSQLRASQALFAPSAVVAEDPKMRALLETARRAAASTSTVLLLGESGTGKEVIAREIHARSPRAEGPFVGVNCAALAETLLESELFGHEKGAFTGASARRLGKIELAHGGTLLLDEIGDVSPAFQAKLLRVLEERSFERVGGTQAVEVDVRVVAATNKDLRARVASGTFREDLFYRLNVITLAIPPLRERSLDIAPLAEHLVRVLAAEAGRAPPLLLPETLDALAAYPWPGNVRELKNALERGVALGPGDELSPADLPPDVVLAGPRPSGGFHEQTEEFRKRLIREALARAGGNQTRAAEALGLQRTYLARLIRQYGL